MGVKARLKENYYISHLYYTLRYTLPSRVFGHKWDIWQTKKKFKRTFGRELDLEHPQTLNEKLQWLKLNVHNDFHTICADKYAVRGYWQQFGADSLIPLLFHTADWRKVTLENLPDIPCIVKSNTGCGAYMIVRDKSKIDIKKLQNKCRRWLATDYYPISQEWQYKNIKPCILVEKLLLDKNGHIPNDYKLNYINGELQFVYCSIDREGENYRSIYSPDWVRMDMEWVEKRKHKHTGLTGKDIPCPPTFERMKKIGAEVAKNFKYVRVDFYDVDGKLYYGEITLHHGSGYDTFEPEDRDLFYGKKLVL